MFKYTKMAVMAFAAAAMVMTTACGDDDNNERDEPNGPEVPGPDNVFNDGTPSSINGNTISKNDQGQVTKMVAGTESITFEYGKFVSDKEYQAVVRFRDTEDKMDDYDVYVQLNDQGFVTTAIQNYLYVNDGYQETWAFQYDAEGHMTGMQRSEGGDRYVITWSGDNIVSVSKDDEDGDHSDYTIAYTDAAHKSPVANKGCVMLYDQTFGIDMDEFSLIYYAGLLGKATANLPLANTRKAVEGGNPYTSTDTFQWILNGNGYPTKFIETESDGYIDVITFAW